MRMRVIALSAVILGLVVATVWYLPPANHQEVTPEPAARGAPTAAEPAAVASRSHERTEEAPAAPAPLPGQTPVTPMAQLLEAKKEELPAEMIEQERAFSAEPVDAAWAPGAEADALAKLAEMSGLALTGLRVECRSTMCRLQVASPIARDPARPPFNTMVGAVGLAPRWVMSVVDSGTLQSIAYLQREQAVAK